jgi:hypothetical protein
MPPFIPESLSFGAVWYKRCYKMNKKVPHYPLPLCYISLNCPVDYIYKLFLCKSFFEILRQKSDHFKPIFCFDEVVYILLENGTEVL